jgi:spore maturation protein A
MLLSLLVAALTGQIGEMSTALIESSEEAITLGLSILGVISLWTGLIKIAENSGLMEALEKKLRPVLHWLFPDIPPGHPAYRYIAANILANLIGLGWAATPPGLKAMESLQSLNEQHPKKASRSMCAFLILNMSSLQLIPVNMLAYRLRYGSANPSEIVGPAILATTVSTFVAIVFIKVAHRRVSV